MSNSTVCEVMFCIYIHIVTHIVSTDRFYFFYILQCYYKVFWSLQFLLSISKCPVWVQWNTIESLSMLFGLCFPQVNLKSGHWPFTAHGSTHTSPTRASPPSPGHQRSPALVWFPETQLRPCQAPKTCRRMSTTVNQYQHAQTNSVPPQEKDRIFGHTELFNTRDLLVKM